MSTQFSRPLKQDLPAAARVQPQALDVEAAILGAILLEREALPRVVDLLKKELFYKPAHQLIYEACEHLFLVSSAVDLLTVVNQLKNNGTLEAAGGVPYVAELSAKVASASNIEHHVHIATQEYLRRELIRTCGQVATDSYDGTVDVFATLATAEQQLLALSAVGQKRESQTMEFLTFQAVRRLEELRQKGGGITGITTGFRVLDELTAGWQPSDLIIIAARPSMGKTAFVLSQARNAALKSNAGVAVFSLEMSSAQLVQRLICSEASLDQTRVRTGRLEDFEWEQLNSRITGLSKAPIYIDDTPALSIQELRAKCRRLKSEKNIQLVIIDYLQLLTIGKSSKNQSREQDISLISRTLKQIAKELFVPIIALSQLSRAVESRGGDKRPMLSDLRESGAIEQDADLVAFLYRPEYYGLLTDEDGNSTVGLCELIIGKQRNGPTDTVKLQFNSRFGQFSEGGYHANETFVPPASTKIPYGGGALEQTYLECPF